jgi:hypothetical protein
MRFKGNQPVPETIHPDPDQPLVRYPEPQQKTDDFSTIEAVTEEENRRTDEANVVEIEQTSTDYWGRRSQETDGVVPAEPPDADPTTQQHPERKPKLPPASNM